MRFDALPAIDFAAAVQVFTELLLAENQGLAAGGTHGDYLRNERERAKIRGKWASFFGERDAFLCPVAATPAILHDHTEPMFERVLPIDGGEMPYLSWFQWAGLVGLADLPVTVVPAGSADGLPVGLQIVTARFRERTGLAIGELLERAGHIFCPPPELASGEPGPLKSKL